MRGMLNIGSRYGSLSETAGNSNYICPYCGGEVYAGERIYAPDGSQVVCEECFCDYLNDLTAEEVSKLFNVDSKQAGEDY